VVFSGGDAYTCGRSGTLTGELLAAFDSIGPVRLFADGAGTGNLDDFKPGFPRTA
jgi:hypothetical protein